MSFSQATPDALRQIGNMRRLERLDLRCCAWVTDDGLSDLRGLNQLRRLDLASTPITDEGLAELAALPNLEQLWIDHCDNLSDEGILLLASFPTLKRVRAWGLSVDESTYRPLTSRRPELLIRINRDGTLSVESGTQFMPLDDDHLAFVKYDFIAVMKRVRCEGVAADE